MAICNACGSPLEKTSTGSYKCTVCGLNYPNPRAKTPLLDPYVKKNPALPPIESEEELTSDMTTFINRLAQKLAPTEGLPADAVPRALKVQERYRKELRNVFLGKGDFNEWFNKTRTERGLHMVTFTQMIHDSLTGLKSPEAQSMREEYAQTIGRIQT